MIAIINYGVGNLSSILNMHKRLGIDAVITHDIDLIEKADKLIIPGVGHFDTCMKNFNDSGLRPAVEQRVLENKVPVLGICVGAQMMTKGSAEGTETGLGWINADTIKMNSNDELGLKVPHMGWTDLKITKPSALWSDLPEEPRFYFAHSYHFLFHDNDFITGTALYGYEFPCSFQKNNIFGVQFHPEKSHKYGMKIISNFASF